MRAYLLFVLFSIGVGQSNFAIASPFEGEWRAAWECPNPTENENKCVNYPNFDEAPDYFQIELWASGNWICGEFHSSILEGNRVDDGTLVEEAPKPNEKSGKDVLHVVLLGGGDRKGTATIQVRGNRLYWKADVTEGEFAMPYGFKLYKYSNVVKDHRTNCPTE